MGLVVYLIFLIFDKIIEHRIIIFKIIGLLFVAFITVFIVLVLQKHQQQKTNQANIQKIHKDVQEKRKQLIQYIDKEIRFIISHSKYVEYNAMKNALQDNLKKYSNDTFYKILSSMETQYKENKEIESYIRNQLEATDREIFLRYDLIIKDEINKLKQKLKSIKKDNNYKNSIGNRYALIIGNSNYQVNRLINPSNDAKAIANKLKMLSFRVDLHIDVNLENMQKAIAAFSKQLKKDDIVVFYYAGHAVQYQGNNYLLPLGADNKIKQPHDLTTQALSMNSILARLSNNSKLKIIILDACRTSPIKTFKLQDGLVRSTIMDINHSDTIEETYNKYLEGTLIAYSTAPGDIALDGTDTHSPYTKYLLQNLGKANFTIENILKKTRADVEEETIGTQIPWYESSINGDFYPAGDNAIEFIDLLNQFSYDLDADMMKDWHEHRDQYSPIKWQTNGLQKDEMRFLYSQDGTILIKNSGIFSHHMLASEKKEPVVWSLKLVGSQLQYNQIRLSNSIYVDIDQANSGELKMDKKYIKDNKVVCHNEVFATDETTLELQTIQLPNKKPLYLLKKEHCRGLKRNCNYEYSIHLSNENLADDPLIAKCQRDKEAAQRLFDSSPYVYPNIQKLSNQITVIDNLLHQNNMKKMPQSDTYTKLGVVPVLLFDDTGSSCQVLIVESKNGYKTNCTGSQNAQKNKILCTQSGSVCKSIDEIWNFALE